MIHKKVTNKLVKSKNIFLNFLFHFQYLNILINQNKLLIYKCKMIYDTAKLLHYTNFIFFISIIKLFQISKYLFQKKKLIQTFKTFSYP